MLWFFDFEAWMIADLSCPIICLQIHDSMNEYQIGFREVRSSIRCDVCLPMMLEDQNSYRSSSCHGNYGISLRGKKINRTSEMWNDFVADNLEIRGLKGMQLCLVKIFFVGTLSISFSLAYAWDHDLLSSQFTILLHHNSPFILNELEVGLAVVSGYLREHKWKSIFKKRFDEISFLLFKNVKHLLAMSSY